MGTRFSSRFLDYYDGVRSFDVRFEKYSELVFELLEIDRPIVAAMVAFARSYWTGELRANAHLIFVAFFLLVSGISFSFSRSNWKRGLRFLAVAAIISLVTLPVEEFTGLRIGIVFGIIHLFAVGTLITYLIRRLIRNEYLILGIGIGILWLGVFWDFTRVPYANSVTWDNLFDIVIGRLGYGADYFGLVPYVGVILIGTVIGAWFYRGHAQPLAKTRPRLESSVCLGGTQFALDFRLASTRSCRVDLWHWVFARLSNLKKVGMK
ncbi:MAG: DUF1624 domain-containing protein [Bacillus subtilis]|nr:DUF1624 domain-containing protein [Bacillus subtilis]